MTGNRRMRGLARHSRGSRDRCTLLKAASSSGRADMEGRVGLAGFLFVTLQRSAIDCRHMALLLSISQRTTRTQYCSRHRWRDGDANRVSDGVPVTVAFLPNRVRARAQGNHQVTLHRQQERQRCSHTHITRESANKPKAAV